MVLELIIFYLAAIFAIGGAVMMIMQRNPVASVLYMVVSLVAQAILYVQLSALFVGALLIIVYAGAIMVLFLFVIMLLNLRGERFTGKSYPLRRGTKITLAAVIFVELIFIIRQLALPDQARAAMTPAPPDFGAVEPVATRLFREFLYPFELTSVLLLVAIIGAVIIARRDRSKDGDTGGESEV
jgi:NADH-quinone oxidoreductase subunit J